MLRYCPAVRNPSRRGFDVLVLQDRGIGREQSTVGPARAADAVEGAIRAVLIFALLSMIVWHGLF